MSRNGRPPKKADEGKQTTLTIKMSAAMKNQIIDLADGYDMTLTEYIITVVNRDASGA